MGTVIHAIRSQPAVCPENKKLEAGNKSAYSFDNEDYSGVYDTDGEALHDALREIEYIRKHHPERTPNLVYIGTCEFFKPSLSGSSWDIIEAVLQQADDEGFGEWTGDYLSVIPEKQMEELEEGLEKVFQEWIDKYNHHATFFIVNSYDVYSYDKDTHELFKETKVSTECLRNIHLWHIGRDSHSRPVYRDEQGKLWKDVNPKADCSVKLCSIVDNTFDGGARHANGIYGALPERKSAFYTKKRYMVGRKKGRWIIIDVLGYRNFCMACRYSRNENGKMVCRGRNSSFYGLPVKNVLNAPCMKRSWKAGNWGMRISYDMFDLWKETEQS